MSQRRHSSHAALTSACLACVLSLLGCDGCTNGEPIREVTPALATSVNALDFGTVYVGATKTLDLTLNSVGTAAVTVGDVEVDATFITLVSGTPTRLIPGDSAVLTLSFAPGAEGEVEGTLTIAHDAASGAKAVVTISAMGRLPPDCDDDNPCTDDVFDLEREECVTIFLSSPCDDANACTENDRCLDGTCVGQALTCADDGLLCTQNACDPEAGCIVIPRHELCGDDDPCTDDVCDAASGCIFPPKPDFSQCGDVVSCVSIELCIQQECRTLPIPEGAPCDDVDVCTTGDSCFEGACVGSRANLPPSVIGESSVLDFLAYQPVFGAGPSATLVNAGVDVQLLPGNVLQVAAYLPDPTEPEVDLVHVTHAYPAFADVSSATAVSATHAFLEQADMFTLIDLSDLDTPVEVDSLARDGDLVQTQAIGVDLMAICTGADVLLVYELTEAGIATPTTNALAAGRCTGETNILIGETILGVIGEGTLTLFPRNGATLGTPTTHSHPRFFVGPGRNAHFDGDTAVVVFASIGGSPQRNVMTLDLTGESIEDIVVAEILADIRTAAIFGDRVFLLDDNIEQTSHFLTEPVVVVESPPFDSFVSVSGNVFESSGDRHTWRLLDGVLRRAKFVGSEPLMKIVPAPDGLWLAGQRDLLRLTRDELAASTPPSTFASPGFSVADVTLLDLPSGPAGGLADTFFSDQGVGHCDDDDCRGDTLFSTDFAVNRAAVDDDGRVTYSDVGTIDVEAFLRTQFSGSGIQGVDIWSVDVRGCAAAFLAVSEADLLAPAYVVIGDRCALGGGIVLLQALELPHRVHATVDPLGAIRVHPQSTLSVVTAGHAYVVDFSDPLVPAFVLEFALPNFMESDDPEDRAEQWAFADMQYVPGTFALALTGSLRFDESQDKDRLIVGTIMGDVVSTRVLDLSLRDEDGDFAVALAHTYRPRHRVLALQTPRAFVSAIALDDNGVVEDTVRIVTLDAPTLELDRELVLDGEATDGVIESGNVYLSRRNGASLISPPCGPESP